MKKITPRIITIIAFSVALNYLAVPLRYSFVYQFILIAWELFLQVRY